MDEEKIRLHHIFDLVEIKTLSLAKLIKNVLFTINKSIDIYEEGFGPLYERHTLSGEAGEVTEDGNISLDWEQLKKYDEDVAKAIIAHEFAHYCLGHYKEDIKNEKDGLRKEEEADALAKKWGFDIDKFRKICGPPTAPRSCYLGE